MEGAKRSSGLPCAILVPLRLVDEGAVLFRANVRYDVTRFRRFYHVALSTVTLLRDPRSALSVSLTFLFVGIRDLFYRYQL